MTSFQFSIVTILLMTSSLCGLFGLVLYQVPEVDGFRGSNTVFPNWIPDWAGARSDVMVVGLFFFASMLPFLFLSRVATVMIYGIMAGATASTLMFEVRYSAIVALCAFCLAIYYVVQNMDKH